MNDTASDKLLTVEEVAEKSRHDRKTVIRWIESGLLIASRPTRRWLIKESDFWTFWDEHKKAVK